jgi:enoyl-CoA hydratase/carnithine racemase
LFPFIALATVRDALPKKVLFEVIYTARLMRAAEALSLHVINEALPASHVLARALALAAQASAYNADVVALGRGLYYRTRARPAAEALGEARKALLAALDAADRVSASC